MAIQLTREQQAVVDSRGGELLVSAAAGSGKTRVLVERLLDRVEQEGLDLTAFLVITFTKAAAAELRGKILAELNRRLSRGGAQHHLRRQLNLVHRAQISTIHAFCTSFLRENSHLLDLDSDFRVADEREANLLRAETLNRVLERRYEDMDGFEALVDALSAGRDDRKLVEITLDIHRRIQAHPDPQRWLEEQSAALRWQPGTDAGATPWGKLLLEDAARQLRYWLEVLEGCFDLLNLDPTLQQLNAPGLAESVEGAQAFLSALESGSWDDARANSDVPFPRIRSSKKIVNIDARERFKERRNSCKDAIQKIADRFEGDSAQLMADLDVAADAVEQLFDLVAELEREFQAAKRRRKLLDFNDLEHCTVRALVQDGQPTELALLWRQRFAEVMVDEYQDTNAVQNAIFDALTDEGKNLFQVGDVKQSIYRFRLADPTIFLHKYHSFRPADQAKPGQPRLLVLSRNFRSQKGVLDAVNFIFEAIMTRSFAQIDYTEDQRLNPGRGDAAEEEAVELDVVDFSTLEKPEREASMPNDQVEARYVASRVRALLDEGPLIPDDGALRPLRPEDVAILYRAPGSVMPYLTTALDEQGIPWQNEGSVNLFETTEVSVALSFLEVIDNPREDVPLLSVLRGPVYGFTPDMLASLRAASPETDLYGCVEKGALAGEEHCIRFLEDLKGLRLRMSDDSCAQLLWALYDQFGLLGLFGAMSGGERRQENLLAFYDFARGFEQRGHRGLFAFVTEIRRLLEQGQGVTSERAASGSGVRIMSIHKSKGLEFPVVVLAGLNRQFNRQDERTPMLFHPQLGVGPKLLDSELRVEVPTLARTAVKLQLERERRAEELRLLYVALTRAKERLILVMSFRDAEKELSRLLGLAAPHPDPEVLNGLDSLGKWMLLPVLCRADAGALWRENRPKQVVQPEDAWRIQLIRADEGCFAPEAAPERVQTPEETVDEAALLRCLHWSYPWEVLSDLPSKVTATQMKGRLLDQEAAEDAHTDTRALPLEFRRPSFARERAGLTPAQAGSAVHTVMEHIDLDRADRPDLVEEELARLVTQGYLTAEQAQAVDCAQVARFWASPLGRAAAESGSLRREFKFSVLAPARRFYPGAEAGEEVLVQGVVDCCFEDLWGFTVVDFKSDRVRRGGEAEAAEQYRGQVEVYARALEEIFEKPVQRRVLWFLRTGKAVEL